MATVVSDVVIAAAARLKELRAEVAALEREEKQIRHLIMVEIEEDEDQRGLTASGAPVVHIQEQHRRGVNREKLEAMFPTIFEQVMEETVVRVLKIDL
jgi:hypothetical protein